MQLAGTSGQDTARPTGSRRPAYRARMALKAFGIGVRLLARLLRGQAMEPSFFIIGAQKAGTTTLFRALAHHPDVLMPLVKEVHYFDLTSHGRDRLYNAHFPSLSAAAEHEAARGIKPMTFDATPYYIFHPEVAGRIKAFAPDARIIAVLRDPVERAWSHYWHAWARGYETLEPLAAFEAESSRLPAPHECVGTSHLERFMHQHNSYLARGEYDRQLPRWFDLFGRDKILLIKSERLFTESNTVVSEVLEFLKLPLIEGLQFEARNIGSYTKAPADIVAWLEHRLAPSMRATQNLLGKEFSWR